MCGIWQLFKKHLTQDEIEKFRELFEKVKNRGPDMSIFLINKTNITGFHRLAINGLNEHGMQPFIFETHKYVYTLICNGEIYNYKKLVEKTLTKYPEYLAKSQSDCEILLPFFNQFCDDNIEQFVNEINGEFALTITRKDKVTEGVDIYLTTDPLSVRPMFYQYIEGDSLLISSLLKGMDKRGKNVRLLQGEIRHYVQEANGSVFFKSSKKYHNYIKPELYKSEENMELYKLIVKTFTDAVEKRLLSDRPICCLLSGGLDSSIVAAVIQRLIKKKNLNDNLTTFTIGMNKGSDLEYAKQVADFIGSTHVEVNFTPEEGLNAIKDVAYACETFDITTIRASVGQHLVAKHISRNTDFWVVFNGDGADEVEMGYLYTYLAPNAEEAQLDSLRLVENISKYDGLRVDRNISCFGLEARVPFLDKEFVDMYLNIDPSLKIPTKTRMEKYLFRRAFEEVYKDDPILPHDILWRKKEAFSDGISQKEKSWYVMTQEHGKEKVNDEDLLSLQNKFKHHVMPTSNESAYYRLLFDEWFGKESEECIPYFWLPNWSTSTDPSARTLQVYNE